MSFLLLFTAWQALNALLALSRLEENLTSVARSFALEDSSQLESAVGRANDDATEAHQNTSGPVWWLAGKMPGIGDDVTALRVVADVARDLTSDTLPALVGGEGITPSSLQPRNGRFNISKIASLRPVVEAGAADIERANDRVQGLELSGLQSLLYEPVRKVQRQLSQAATAAEAASTGVRILPGMLGGAGKRNYLLLFQNNAEIRAQGGMPGSIALLQADGGAIRMVRQGGPIPLIGAFPEPFIRLTPEERLLFTERAVIYPQDTTFIPDFERSSELISRMWERRQPEKLDGVISVDPVALSYMLRGLGPVQLANGRVLTSETADTYLMKDVYLNEADGDTQNAIFADAAKRVFDRFVSSSDDPLALMLGLGQGVSEGRVKVWSKSPGEAAVLADSKIAGLLPVDSGREPQIGVYVNDSAADKLSAYFDYRVDVEARSCSASRQTLAVTITMKSFVPEGASLPPSVVGPPTNPTPPGDILNTVYLYAPTGGYIVSARLDDQQPPVGEFVYRGREVGAVTVGLGRGQTRTLEYEVRTGEGQTGGPSLTTTPGALGDGMGRVSKSAC